MTHPAGGPGPAAQSARERASRSFLILAPAALVGSGEVKAGRGYMGAGGAVLPVPCCPAVGPPGGRDPARAAGTPALP